MTVIYMFVLFYITQSDESDFMSLIWILVIAGAYFFDMYASKR